MKRRHASQPEILTPREWEVLSLLSDGLTTGEIAKRLGVAENTVEAELTEIFSKLEIGDRTAAARLSRSLQSEQQPLLVGSLLNVFKRTSWAAVLKVGGIAAGIIGVVMAALLIGFR